MANIKSSAKRAKQNAGRAELNRYFRTSARTYVKRAKNQIAADDLEGAAVSIQHAIKALDKAAQKGVIHRNNAARRKSRLMKAYNRANVAA